MRHYGRIAALALAVAVATGCETDSRTHETDDGGILLSISSINGLPIAVSASVASQTASIGSITVASIVKNPGQGSSQLMNVEIDSYEVTYTRADNGTRVPPRLKNFIIGSVPAGGTFTLINGPFLRRDQFDAQPFEDMRELGFDPETTSTVIRFRVGIQFFGRTLSGDIVQTEPGFFTLDVVP